MQMIGSGQHTSGEKPRTVALRARSSVAVLPLLIAFQVTVLSLIVWGSSRGGLSVDSEELEPLLLLSGVALALTAVWGGMAWLALRRLARGKQASEEPARDEGGSDGSLTELHQELEEARWELDHLAHIASHDLKAPLRAMGLLASWIEEDSGPALGKEARGHLATLQQRVDRMMRLLEDLLEYTQAGKVRNGTQRVDLLQLAAQAVSLSGVPGTMQIELCGEAVSMRTDPALFVQVLMNLVRNAWEHHHGTEGQLRVEVGDDGEEAWVEVSDDGPGIPPEHLGRIFEPFVTLKPRDEHDSSGVGLAWVQRILSRLGGSIEVRSALGKGTTFRVRWPKNEEENRGNLRNRPASEPGTLQPCPT